MTLRRTWISVVVLLAAVAVSAQTTPVTPEITAEQKAEVLAQVDKTLKETAFVPGVKFDQWPKFLEERKDRIDTATTKRSFASSINRALRDFGLSHMSVTLKREAPRGVILALQEPQTRPTFAMQELTWLDDKTVVFRLRTFSERYDRKEVEKLMAEAAKAETMILDLRSNGGGAVVNLQHFLSHFLAPRTVVGTMVSRRIANAYERETSKDPSDGREIAKWTNSHFRTSTLKTESIVSRIPSSIFLAISTSPSRLRRATIPISRRYIFTGSPVLPTTGIRPRRSSSLLPASSSAAFFTTSFSPLSVSMISMFFSPKSIMISSI